MFRLRPTQNSTFMVLFPYLILNYRHKKIAFTPFESFNVVGLCAFSSFVPMLDVNDESMLTVQTFNITKNNRQINHRSQLTNSVYMQGLRNVFLIEFIHSYIYIYHSQSALI